MNTTAKNVFLWILIVVAVVLLWNFFNTVKNGDLEEMKYSTFTKVLENDQGIDASEPLVMTGNVVEGYYLKAGTRQRFTVVIPKGAEETVADGLVERGLDLEIKPDDEGGWMYVILTSWFPIILFVAFWIFLMRQMQTGGNKALSFGKSRAKLSTNQQKKVTFRDVAGIEEAKEELQEIVEFLREPQKYQSWAEGSRRVSC